VRLIFVLPCLLVVLNWLWPLPLSPVTKILPTGFLFMGSQYHYWARLSSGSPLLPEFPRPLIILFNWAFSAIAFLALFQLALDLGVLLVAVVQWRWVSIPVIARVIIGACSALLAAIGVANAIKLPTIREVTVTISNLSASFDGYRVLQLTDLHLTRLFPEAWARSVVTRANAADADLIVVTGDFIDGSVDMRRRDIAPLKELHAPDGIFAVPGNHEYYFDYERWIEHLESLGITMLLNTHNVLTRGSDHLVVAGVTDLSAARHGQVGPDLGAALAGIPASAPVILLDHQPRNARTAAERSVALQLSGHTHGGMILGLDRLVARGNEGFVSGRYDLGNMTLYVSNGTGLWPGFALRLGKPSEITRFHLRAG